MAALFSTLTDAKRTVLLAFDRVASRYDFLTSLNPGYRRHLRRSVERLALPRCPRVLDLCCGTGLSTEAILAVAPDAQVVALDASAGMLACARQKRGLASVRFVLGDASDAVAAGVTGTFDGVLMAYGIRDLPQPDLALQRILALLAPGARAVFHEYSVRDSRLRQAIWNAVCRGVIVPSGFFAGGDAAIYRYLRRSVNAFDGVAAFEQRLRTAGFVEVRTQPMDGWQRGIVHSFIGCRP